MTPYSSIDLDYYWSSMAWLRGAKSLHKQMLPFCSRFNIPGGYKCQLLDDKVNLRCRVVAKRYLLHHKIILQQRLGILYFLMI